MPVRGNGAVYPLTGGVYTGIAIDATGTPADGDVRVKPELPSPPRDGKAYYSFSVSPTATDATYTFQLRDYTDNVNLDTVGATGNENRDVSEQIYDDLIFGNEYGLRMNVSSASGTAGATADVAGYLYIEPRG